MTFSSLNDIIKSTHAIDAKGGRLPIGIPGRLQIGMHGRLRRYPHAEIMGSGESVSAVARRHGLSPQQLFGWRRQLQASPTALSDAEELQFVPAVLDVAPSSSSVRPSSSVRRQRKMPRHPVEPGAGMIEVEIDGVTVRVGRGADAKTVTAVLRALKATA